MAAWRTSWESASERLSHSAGQREKRPLTRGPASFTNKQQQSPTDSMYEEGKQQRRTDIRLSVLLRIAVEMERFLEADFFNGRHCTYTAKDNFFNKIATSIDHNCGQLELER